MQSTSYGITNLGKVRHTNEDALFIDETHQVYAVADGLGGLPGGAEASQRIVQLLEQKMKRVDSSQERVDLTELINGIVFKEGLDAYPLSGMGSTLTIGQIVGDQLLIGHIGDSAAYLLRDDDLEKLTIDHTMAQELIERQGESAQDVIPPEYSHTLTRCVGQSKNLRVDSKSITIKPGDRLLLCTDGLDKGISREAIKKGLARKQSPEEACHQLTQMANDNEGPDNITVIVIHTF